MVKKILLFTMVMLIVTVSVGFTAVTVTIDDQTKAVGEDITIPINITGFDEYIAGEFILNSGGVSFTNVSIEAGDGTVYTNGLADYSQITKEADYENLLGWYNTKDAAIDYKVLGSKIKIFLWAPKALKELGNASGDGILFNIKAKVGVGATSDIITFGGKVFNANLSTRKLAKLVSDFAKLNITGTTPIQVFENIEDIPDITNVTQVINVGTLPTPGKIPVQLTLKTPATAKQKAEVTIKKDTLITKEDGTTYQGVIKPPEIKEPEELTDEEVEELPETWKEENNFVKVIVGNPAEKLLLDKPALVILEVSLKSSSAKVYYLDPIEGPQLAGVAGKDTIEGQEVEIPKGGKIIEGPTLNETTEKYDMKIAVLFDHMSEYVVGPELPAEEAAVTVGGGGDTCFIATAAYGSPMEKHVKLLKKFRDVYLMPHRVGRYIVDLYYHYSPPVAKFIERHETVKDVVRITLMPVIGFSYLMLSYGISWYMVFGLVAAMIIMIIGFGFYLWRFRMFKE